MTMLCITVEYVTCALVLVAVDCFRRLHLCFFSNVLVAMWTKLFELVRHRRSLYLEVDVLDVLVLFAGRYLVD